MRFYYQSPLPQLPSGRGRNHRRHTNDHHRHPSPMIYRPPSYAHARWNETHPYPQDQPHAMSSIPYFEGSYFEHNYTNSNNLQQSDSHTNTKVTRSTHHLLPPPIQRCHQPPSTIKAPIFVPGPNTTHFPLLPLSAHRPSTDGMQYHHNNLYPSYPNIKEDCSMIIDDVRETDVLCGRGAPSQYHAGNTHFQQLVNRFQSSYIAARRLDKPEIAMHLVHVVRNRGGRFLKRTKLPGLGPSGHFGWQEIGEQRAYEKACQALREGAPDVRRKLATQEVAAAALCSIGKTKPLFCAFSGEQQPAIIHSTTGGEQLTGASCKSDWKEDRDDVDQVATVREEQSSDDTERM